MIKPIKGIEISEPFFMAPLAGITDRSFRTLCAEQGASMLYSEMISAKGLVYGDRGTERLLKIGENETTVGFQIFGSDPEIMARAVIMLEDRKNLLIDVNMGCPVPKVVKNGEGVALMKDPELIYKIIKGMVEVTRKPVTAKIRTGWDMDSVNCVEVAKALQEAGASAVTVHGRTGKQMYSGNADRNIIKAVKEAVEIPVIANGDIFSGEEAMHVLRDTGCDYVMIARGALGNPWIFKESISLRKGLEYDPPALRKKVDTMKRHLNMLCEDKGERVAVCEMRKHTGWYLKGVRGASCIRRKINGVHTVKDYLAVLDTVL